MTTTFETKPFTTEDLPAANELLADLSAEERLQWAAEQFDDSLWALTSAGVDSPVLPQLLKKAGVRTNFVHINTGVQYPEIFPFLIRLSKEYDLTVVSVKSEWGDLSDEEAAARYEEDSEQYRNVTKREPLSRAINELGITALLSGVRADQTENRSNLDFIGLGNSGEFRIHPILDWSEYKISEFSADEGLLLHPLNHLASIGDRIHTTAGEGRSGRLEEKSECGLHLNLACSEPAAA